MLSEVRVGLLMQPNANGLNLPWQMLIHKTCRSLPIHAYL